VKYKKKKHSKVRKFKVRSSFKADLDNTGHFYDALNRWILLNICLLTSLVVLLVLCLFHLWLYYLHTRFRYTSLYRQEGTVKFLLNELKFVMEDDFEHSLL